MAKVLEKKNTYLSCKAPCQKIVQILKVYMDSKGDWKKILGRKMY